MTNFLCMNSISSGRTEYHEPSQQFAEATLLADLQEDKSRFRVSTRMAALSLVVSAASILIAIFWKGGAVMLP